MNQFLRNENLIFHKQAEKVEYLKNSSKYQKTKYLTKKMKQKNKFYSVKLPLILVLAAIITYQGNKHSEISN